MAFIEHYISFVHIVICEGFDTVELTRYQMRVVRDNIANKRVIHNPFNNIIGKIIIIIIFRKIKKISDQSTVATTGQGISQGLAWLNNILQKLPSHIY
ncbi:hypothetical protein DFA_04726 [Cavenderia fasciculata]|uniref:Uncharacterized protein n=1 Tax=Cavenderia fasciculata TaxID=261658 RepID=F4PQD3_CACFS|nr:uncharacterized protein DFA_04726 [Cavenderia fasciculata]EGG22596.1 hypothetical protein DFA_04726 [Cavenderia fasciculata]|eukprot:XP_004360447.1 hypothetical protein DFA_04726 [Cavenderia fasciculata]